MRISTAAFGLAGLAVIAHGTAPGWAANAGHPYSNIDQRFDRGGDTGDSRVEALNQQQLDAARSGHASPTPTGESAGRALLGAPLLQPLMPIR